MPRTAQTSKRGDPAEQPKTPITLPKPKAKPKVEPPPKPKAKPRKKPAARKDKPILPMVDVMTTPPPYRPPKADAAPPTGTTVNEIRLPPLWDWQRQVIGSRARYRVVNAARQIGKTFLGVFLALDEAMRGGDVWWIAPDFSLTEPGYDLLLRVVDQPPFNQKLAGSPYKLVEEYKQRKLFTVRNGGRVGTIQIKSADDPQKLRGKTLTLAILDEFAFMHPDAWYDGVIHALTVKRGRALFISTPFGRNTFWDLYRLGDPTSPDYNPEWQSFTFDQTVNPLISPDEIEEKRLTMPLRKFEREVLAKFVDMGGEVFVNVRKQAQIIPGTTAYDPTHTYVGGFDISGGRHDYHVLIVFDATAMKQVAMIRFSTQELGVITNTLKAAYELWHLHHIDADETTIGIFPIREFLNAGIPIRPVNMNIVTKRAVIEEYAAAVELGRLLLLNEPQLIKEHEAMESTVTPSGHVQYNSPKGGTDDTVTASALAYRAATVKDETQGVSFARLPFTGLYNETRGQRTWQFGKRSFKTTRP